MSGGIQSPACQRVCWTGFRSPEPQRPQKPRDCNQQFQGHRTLRTNCRNTSNCCWSSKLITCRGHTHCPSQDAQLPPNTISGMQRSLRCNTHIRDPGWSSVSCLDYDLDDQGIVARFQAEARHFCLLQSVQMGFQTHLTSYSTSSADRGVGWSLVFM